MHADGGVPPHPPRSNEKSFSLEPFVPGVTASSKSQYAPDPFGYVDFFMQRAFAEAELALRKGEVPIGCVLVRSDRRVSSNEGGEEEGDAQSLENSTTDTEEMCISALEDRIESTGHNLTNLHHHALAHAEFVAIQRLLNAYAGPSSGDEDGLGVETDLLAADSAARRPPLCDLYVTVEPCVMCGTLLLYHSSSSSVGCHDVVSPQPRDSSREAKTDSNCPESARTSSECVVSASSYRGIIDRVFFGCGNPRFGGNGTVLGVHKDGIRLCPNDEASPRTGYRSHSGYRAGEAISLLQQFYLHENGAAPDEKRRRKDLQA